MTEVEWLASTDPERMLEHLLGSEPPSTQHRTVTERKLGLFASECVHIAYDGTVLSNGPDSPPLGWTVERWAQRWASEEGGNPHVLYLATRAALLRCIFGNPWRPWEQYASCNTCGHWFQPMRKRFYRCPKDDGHYRGGFRRSRLPPPWLTWNDGTVPRLAQRIYDGRHFDCMPMLADALEEAGCDNEDILNHCRGLTRCPCEAPAESRRHRNGLNPPCTLCCETPGWRPAIMHARGCHVLDLLLGKE